MILALLLTSCVGGTPEGNWMRATDDAPVVLGEVVSALWWDWPEAGGALVVLSEQPVTCAELRAFEANEALGLGPTLNLFFPSWDTRFEGYEGDYVGGVDWSSELWTGAGAEVRIFLASVLSRGEEYAATLQPSVATVASVDRATAQGHAEGDWFEAQFVAEVCQEGSAEDDDCVPAGEVCDGVDNDCDGRVDEGVMQTLYADGDGDGYGDANSSQEGCEGAGLVGNGGDCDDADATVFPGNVESCNGIDDDCDGKLDEEAC